MSYIYIRMSELEAENTKLRSLIDKLLAHLEPTDEELKECGLLEEKEE